MKKTLPSKLLSICSVALIALTIFVSIKPQQAKAINLLDPFCLFSCKKSSPAPVFITTTNANSNNVTNSNNVVKTINTTGTVVASNPVYPTNPNQGNYQQYNPVTATCSASRTSGNIGDSVTWNVYTYGGDGSSYYITWSGNDGLSGYGRNIYKTYNNAGTKYASVTVTSGGQTVTQNCYSNVLIYDNYNYNNGYSYNYNDNYNYNNSNSNYNYSSPIYVSCYANTTSITTGSNVSWQANASGGNGYFTYNWNGTDTLHGYNNILNVIYNYVGLKTASVTVTSGNQTITQTCSNSINVTAPYYNYNNQNNSQGYIQNNQTGSIQVACYPDKINAKIGSPVTWGVEALGGGNYTYAWTGTDGLTSSQSSVVTTYGSTGTKSATVTVTSNGQSITQACGSTVYISSNVQNSNTVTKSNNNTQNQNGNPMSAAALFSLQNVPWGWVAVLVILTLMTTIVYLIYNRNKI